MNKKSLFTFLSLAISLFLSDRPINQPVAHTPENKPAAYNSSHSLKTSAVRGDVSKKHQILALNHVDSYHDSASVPENKTTPSTSGAQSCRSSMWLFNQESVTVLSYETKHFVKAPVAHTVQSIDHGLHPQKMNTRLNEKYIQLSQKLPSVGITKKNSNIKKAEVQAQEARARDHYNKNLQKKTFEVLKKALQDALKNAAQEAQARDHYNKNLQKKTFEVLKKAVQEERLRKQEEEKERLRHDAQDLKTIFMNKINNIHQGLEKIQIEEREAISSSPNDLSPSAWIVQTLTNKIYDYLHALYVQIKGKKDTIGQTANQYTKQISNLSSEDIIQIATAKNISNLEEQSFHLLTIWEQYEKLKTAIHTLGQKNESNLDSRIANETNDVKDILKDGENGISAITTGSITKEVQKVIKDTIDNNMKENMGIGKAVSIEYILENLKKQYEDQWNATLKDRYRAMKEQSARESGREYMMAPSTRGPSNPIPQHHIQKQRRAQIKRILTLQMDGPICPPRINSRR